MVMRSFISATTANSLTRFSSGVSFGELIAVFIFDLIAFGLAVAAEQRRSTLVFILRLYASVAWELAAVVRVLEDVCEAEKAVEIAEKLVEGQRLQGFMVNFFFNILDLIGLVSLWMILGDLGSLSLNLTV